MTLSRCGSNALQIEGQNKKDYEGSRVAVFGGGEPIDKNNSRQQPSDSLRYER